MLRQLLFKGRWIAFVDYDDFNFLGLTQRQDQFRAEAQQAICVRQHQSPDSLAQDQFEKVIESFLAIVQARTKVGRSLLTCEAATPSNHQREALSQASGGEGKQ
jgi:hypothetical protein